MNRAALGLPGLALLLMLAGGCGQNEGGRCQIASDCASGLTCITGDSANGKCVRPGAGPVANDAAIRSDVAGEPASDASPDQAPPMSEVQPDLAPPDSAPADTSALDSEESEAGGLDAT